MKKLVCMTLAMAMTAALFVACNNDGDDEDTPPAAPTIAMDGADIDAVHEIVDGMTVKVQVAAPATISGFEVDIDSPVLTEEMLASVGLTKKFDLTKVEGAMATALKGLGFPVADQVTGQASLAFDISTLIPLIAMLPPQMTSDHNFKLTVTDAKNQSTVKTLKFHLTGTSDVTYNNDADVWANTASFAIKLGDVASEVKLEYKRSTTTAWQQATVTANVDGTYTATITPKWVAAADHKAGVKQFTLDNAAGVFAGAKYDYRVLADGQAIEGLSGSFDAPKGQTIPGGDMESWSKSSAWDVENSYNGGFPIFYPNAENQSFWANGNNAMTQELCLPDMLADNTYAAKLKGKFMFITFAAGNLFTGIFDFKASELSGYARFGDKYQFTARPTALKVRYKATITKFTYISPLKEGELTTDMIDKARIFVCITDWTERHSVMSGMGALQDGGKDKINAFDPEVDASTAEGKILAYGSKWLDASTTGSDWVELVIPIIYKEDAKNAKPAAENYSLSISCASSAYGDFLCGSENNDLYLDSFEWVY